MTRGSASEAPARGREILGIRSADTVGPADGRHDETLGIGALARLVGEPQQQTYPAPIHVPSVLESHECDRAPFRALSPVFDRFGDNGATRLITFAMGLSEYRALQLVVVRGASRAEARADRRPAGSRPLGGLCEATLP